MLPPAPFSVSRCAQYWLWYGVIERDLPLREAELIDQKVQEVYDICKL